jgi:hypothetical protein
MSDKGGGMNEPEPKGHSRANLEMAILKSPDWQSETAGNALNKIYEHVRKEAQDAHDWYIVAKGKKSGPAKLLRVLMIVLTAIAGTAPIAIDIFQRLKVLSIVTPLWATIPLALAGVLLALDQLLGFSSGWVRYTKAATRLRELLNEFDMDWQSSLTEFGKKDPTPEQIKGMLARAKKFIMDVKAVIREETNEWISDFQHYVDEFNRSLKEKIGKDATPSPGTPASPKP